MDIKKQHTKLYNLIVAGRDAWFSPLATLLIKLGVNANHISFLRFLFLVPIVFLLKDFPMISFSLIMLNFILDMLDGAVARKNGKDSIKGRIVDLSIDHFYVIPIVMGLIYYELATPLFACIYIFLFTTQFFVNAIRHGVKIGKYPFNYDKYFIYGALLVFALNGNNWFDLILIFWNVVIFIDAMFNITYMYLKLRDGRNI